jgi:hypothetical protein
MSKMRTMMVGRPKLPDDKRLVQWSVGIDQETFRFLKRKGRKAAAWVRMAIFEARKK